MNQVVDECEQLRMPERVCEPDPRTHIYANIDKNTGETSPRILKNQYDAVACFVLNVTVPKNVAIHFETAKNLFLYAWFVYRFYPVAEQHALGSLEFALRERFPDFVTEQSKKRGFGLKKLLNHAIENNHVKNEMFTTLERWARRRAEGRHAFERMQKMRLTGLNSVQYSDSEIVITQEDLDCDWLEIFKETIPKIRNNYAHGSAHLMPMGLHTFEMVVELINQLYPKKIRSES